MIDSETKKILEAPLPDWALKPHPAKKASDGKPMTVINPMAVIERLNEAFGVGTWNFATEYIQCVPFKQKTKNGERDVYMSAVKASISIPKWELYIEQYGGSTNDDMGDALKGGATDALTKIASYLGIGASIYKGIREKKEFPAPGGNDDDDF